MMSPSRHIFSFLNKTVEGSTFLSKNTSIDAGQDYKCKNAEKKKEEVNKTRNQVAVPKLKLFRSQSPSEDRPQMLSFSKPKQSAAGLNVLPESKKITTAASFAAIRHNKEFEPKKVQDEHLSSMSDVTLPLNNYSYIDKPKSFNKM